MATASNRHGPAPTSFAGAGRSFSGAALRLPVDTRGPYTLMINAAKPLCRSGVIVPATCKAYHQPGFGGNIDGDMGAGYAANLRQIAGWVEIPHERPVVAFGEKRTVPSPSNYLTEHRGVNAKNQPITYWTHAWKRPVPMGPTVEWETDYPGRDAWLHECWEIVGGLKDQHVDAAIKPVIAACYRLMDRSDKRGQRHLLIQVRQLPADHVPYDLEDIYAEATQTKKRPTKK